MCNLLGHCMAECRFRDSVHKTPDVFLGLTSWARISKCLVLKFQYKSLYFSQPKLCRAKAVALALVDFKITGIPETSEDSI